MELVVWPLLMGVLYGPVEIDSNRVPRAERLFAELPQLTEKSRSVPCLRNSFKGPMLTVMGNYTRKRPPTAVISISRREPKIRLQLLCVVYLVVDLESTQTGPCILRQVSVSGSFRSETRPTKFKRRGPSVLEFMVREYKPKEGRKRDW